MCLERPGDGRDFLGYHFHRVSKCAFGDVDPQVERGYGYAISDWRVWRWENRKGDSSYVRDSKDFSGLKINFN